MTEQRNSEGRPLAGVRVIDFGQYMAGPAAAMMLADLGAEVIHVDPPGGPRWQSPAAAMLNRGKSCVALDLKSGTGLAEARRLIASADVVIENFRPGVMARFGLDADTIDRSDLIYLSLPGFASTDPQRAGIRAWEAVIAAACGQYSDMGLNRVLMGIEPSFSPLPLASAYASVLGAASVVLALCRREKGGGGDVIEVPLASALMEGLAYNSQQVEDYPDRYKSNREKEIERRRAEGLPMDATYGQLQELLDPFYRNYMCADGRQIYVVSASHSVHPERVLKILGLWDRLVAEGLPRHYAYDDVADWPGEDGCSLSSYPLSQAWADRVSSLMKEAFLARPSFEWETIFGENGAPAAAQRTTQEWLSAEHPQKARLLIDVDDPDYGPMRQLGNLAWLAGDAETASKKAPRRLAEPEQIAAEPKPEPAAAPAGGGWLDGIRILDLTNVIAGPTIASTLARFGAEVISVDPVTPTMDPWNGIIFGMQAGRGKQSLLMDLKSEKGRQALDRLIGWADIVTVNATDRQLARLGLDPDRLQAAHPGVILCQLDCYGGSMRGPHSDFPGYDDLAQAVTGVMARFGGSLDTPEEHAHFGTIDVLGGFCGALAAAAALFQRARTGRGDVARASLCAAGQLIQAPFMFDFEGRPPFDEPSGRTIKGAGPLYRAYLAEDGWFFLAAFVDDIEALAIVDGLGAIRSASPQMRAATLEEIFAGRPVAHWIGQLRKADIGCHALDKMHAVRDAHLARESAGPADLKSGTFGFIRHDRHPSGRWVDLVAPNAIRPQRAAITVPGPMPKPGVDGHAILSGLGYSGDEIDAMIKEGVVARQWCDKYLPE
ncbi:CoA transferase [Hoeflea poritis]|uniref:CoA transferase n=1 Tax=Hoeflea poritis TaxID=2993659 RepID=A0ABT4VRG1_9HYPH|nr:CoA transferase [Hoeflea poritis]MDA4847274.1 CoA transferase [Hoeflea poritis]